jgi:hypothetical protein
METDHVQGHSVGPNEFQKVCITHAIFPDYSGIRWKNQCKIIIIIATRTVTKKKAVLCSG